MFNVNAFFMNFDKDTKKFCFSKSKFIYTSIDDYSGLMKVKTSCNDSILVKPDEVHIVSFSSCCYYTTDNVSEQEIFNMLKKTLVQHNSSLILRSSDVLALLAETTYSN